MKIKYSKKITKLPPYLFAEIDRLKEEIKNKGVEILSMSIGDPDGATPQVIIDSLKQASELKSNHHYPSYSGMNNLREEISIWFKKRYNIDLSPENEIVSLIGSKEGIGHLPLAFIDRDDIVLIPDPAYPVYRSGTIFAEGIPYFMPLLEQNNFLPNLNDIPTNIRNKAKIMFLNYPNNPTSALATEEFFREVVTFAEKYNIIVAHDAAYNEIYFDKPPKSFLEIPGAMEIGIEFHSFSKTFNMTGWRIGFAAGNKEIVKGLGNIKSNLDSGIFQAIQISAITALKNYDSISESNRKLYKSRRDTVLSKLDELGWTYLKPEATFYVWIKCIEGYNSSDMAQKLLQEQGIAVTPGVGFGKYGEGFIRLALTVNNETIKKVFDKIKKIKW